MFHHCYVDCRSANVDEFEQNDCASKCYANYTLLLSDDGKLNKNVVKRIYNGNALHDAQWMKVIDKTVDSCEFIESDSLTKSLASFYECVNHELEDNCVKFANTRDCDKVEEYFKTCKDIQLDCSSWPEELTNPKGCCKTVALFSRELTQSCRKKCAMKELYIPRQLRCTDQCLFIDSNVRVDRMYDFNVVKSLLLENSKTNSDWEKPIENAVEKCEKKLKGL